MFVSGNILSFLNQESVIFIVSLKAFISHRLWDLAYEIKTRKKSRTLGTMGISGIGECLIFSVL